ncbi:hypothetical protein C922_02677 [Plasmodium inui San Antonio 1]|uniref:Uncharacterized protein n=1 Tax=Plasmodium inui San Antonio 1 TaxID=1237626 RepID=W7A783_9APIC|nr:hypothetical protein C922_02677 [Plasmodium inui San Antonio 1]EUD67093.1 hypothetical protein C922_02677 [Plasmodium inui San Antonio 1]
MIIYAALLSIPSGKLLQLGQFSHPDQLDRLNHLDHFHYFNHFNHFDHFNHFKHFHHLDKCAAPFCKNLCKKRANGVACHLQF